MDPDRGSAITVGRASNVRRDKNAFVKLTLEPGWSLERRVYQGRTLSHVYFANAQPLQTLIAANQPQDAGRQASPPMPSSHAVATDAIQSGNATGAHPPAGDPLSTLTRDKLKIAQLQTQLWVVFFIF